MKPVLLDTGVIVALLDRSKQFHERCAEAVWGLERSLVTCEAVIAETCYLVRTLAGAAAAVVKNVEAGVFQLPFSLSRSAEAVQRLLREYQNAPISLADACLIRTAEELGTGDILTLDRDFEVYRWGRNRPFRLLIPPLGG